MNTQIREQMLLTTVVKKPHQGSFPKSGCYRFRGSFLGTFLWHIPRKVCVLLRGRSKKVKNKKVKEIKN